MELARRRIWLRSHASICVGVRSVHSECILVSAQTWYNDQTSNISSSQSIRGRRDRPADFTSLPRATSAIYRTTTTQSSDYIRYFAWLSDVQLARSCRQMDLLPLLRRERCITRDRSSSRRRIYHAGICEQARELQADHTETPTVPEGNSGAPPSVVDQEYDIEFDAIFACCVTPRGRGGDCRWQTSDLNDKPLSTPLDRRQTYGVWRV